MTGIDDRELPLTLALMPVLPRHKIDVSNIRRRKSANSDVGSGPYLVADVKPGQRIVLRRDPNYWAKDLPIRRGLYNFDEIDIEYFRDANSSVRSLQRRASRFPRGNQSGALDEWL